MEGEEEKISAKNKEEWKTYLLTKINHTTQLIYFSHKSIFCFHHFPMLLLNGAFVQQFNVKLYKRLATPIVGIWFNSLGQGNFLFCRTHTLQTSPLAVHYKLILTKLFYNLFIL